MKLIDIHAHIFPDEFGPAPAGCDPASWPSTEPNPDVDGGKFLVNGPMRFPAAPAWFEAERRLEASARSGVDAELLSPFPALLNYRATAEVGRDLCRVTNEYIAGLVSAYPARFYGLGTVPMQDPDLAAAELTEVAKAGLPGVEIASNINGTSLHDPRFDGFFAECERLGSAIFIHGMPAPTDRIPGPATATFGVSAEGALAATAIISGGVAEKYPNLKIAFSHAAGGFALMLTRAQWFWGRTWNEEPPLPEDQRPEAKPWFAARGPIELARRFYYDSLVFDRRAIRYLVDMLGADRLLVGSDFPAMPREDPCGKTLRSMGLADAELEDILWHNCFRFLGIDPPKLSWWQRTEPLPSPTPDPRACDTKPGVSHRLDNPLIVNPERGRALLPDPAVAGRRVRRPGPAACLSASAARPRHRRSCACPGAPGPAAVARCQPADPRRRP
jgi:aminocarboxymuconate-semialdehyde decarboxylase